MILRWRKELISEEGKREKKKGMKEDRKEDRNNKYLNN